MTITIIPRPVAYTTAHAPHGPRCAASCANGDEVHTIGFDYPDRWRAVLRAQAMGLDPDVGLSVSQGRRLAENIRNMEP